MPDEVPLHHKIKWAEHPQRKCRLPFTDDGLIDKTCELPDRHPGPDAARSSVPSMQRRLAWEAANQGWEKTVSHDDPFADITEQMKRTLWHQDQGNTRTAWWPGCRSMRPSPATRPAISSSGHSRRS